MARLPKLMPRAIPLTVRPRITIIVRQEGRKPAKCVSKTFRDVPMDAALELATSAVVRAYPTSLIR